MRCETKPLLSLYDALRTDNSQNLSSRIRFESVVGDELIRSPAVVRVSLLHSSLKHSLLYMRQTRKTGQFVDMVHYHTSATGKFNGTWPEAVAHYRNMMRNPDHINFVTVLREPRSHFLRYLTVMQTSAKLKLDAIVVVLPPLILGSIRRQSTMRASLDRRKIIPRWGDCLTCSSVRFDINRG